ncbi:MAG: sugar ABC transporter permease, partial [Gorillibacterium sp.]|nr:sugar ABC transporter permease [Gorillibacterium sp.]
MSKASRAPAASIRVRSHRLRLIRGNLDMYALLIPGIVFLLLFKYTPMYGIVIAFQDFNIFSGITGSEWVGLANFEKLIHSDEFLQVLINTLLISLY